MPRFSSLQSSPSIDTVLITMPLERASSATRR